MKIKLVIIFAVLCCSCFISCQDPLGYKDAHASAGGYGTFSLETGGINSGRTILPTAMQSDFAAYSLIFTSDYLATVTADRTNSTLADIITLPIGNWNLTVTAFMDGGKTLPCAQGSLYGITISAGTNTGGSVDLKPIIEAGAAGTFSWDISYPEEVTTASITITPLNTLTGTMEQTLYFVGGTPLIDSNTASSPLSLNTGYYRVEFNLSNGDLAIGRVEYLHVYKNMLSHFAYAFTRDHFTVNSVTNNADSGPGSLRYAIENAASDSTILIEDSVGTIALMSRLEIQKNLNIAGNGVTLTRNSSWTDSYSEPLLFIGAHVTISRIHFKDVKNSGFGVILNYRNLTLESCIFSGNQGVPCGAVLNGDTLCVKGCTFYGNSADYGSYGGAAVYNSYNVTLEGNLFYGNAAGMPVVYGGETVSLGYNVVDVPLGTASNESGWLPNATDATFADLHISVPLDTDTYKPVLALGNVIPSAPAGFPATDFYGNVRAFPGAPGAVSECIPAVTVTVTYNANGATGGTVPTDSTNYIIGQTVTVLGNTGSLTRTGYFFAGWDTVSNGSGTSYKAGSTFTMGSGNVTLYAMWGGDIISPSGIKMAYIPAGTFTMGSPSTEPGRLSDETRHQVTLTTGFYMGKYEVTQEQYKAVMNGANPSNWKYDNRPVETVNWYDTIVFCNKLSVMEGLTPAYSISGSTDPAAWGTVPEWYDQLEWEIVTIVPESTGYRLPTEAQWEYACRAGTTTAFNWGSNYIMNDYIDGTQANYYASYVDANNPWVGIYLQRTTDVGSYAPNAWGLYDMHGNVSEWCWDWYGSYGSSAVEDPMGASSGYNRVLRGGNWNNTGQYLRSAYRFDYNPNSRINNFGFRLLRPVSTAGALPLTGTVTVSGTVLAGETLTADGNGLNGSGAISWQWYRDGNTIGGATGSTYAVSFADAGSAITVTASRSGNTGSVTGAAANIVPNPQVSISGIPETGQTLTANISNIGGIVSYQWLRGSVSIGANSNAYTVQPADSGWPITVTVACSGVTGTVTSAAVQISDASDATEITVEMWDSWGDGWDGAGALRINVNGNDISPNAKANGSCSNYYFSVFTGDMVYFYWIAGTNQGENAFAIYYSNDPPNPAFNPYPGSWTQAQNDPDGKVLIYKQYYTMDTIPDGALLGSFTVSSSSLQPVPEGINITFNQLDDLAPAIAGPAIRIVGSISDIAKTISIANPAQYESGSIKWFFNGNQITGPDVSGSSGEILTLRSSVYNKIGTYFVTVEVTKAAKRYSKAISFTVGL